MSTSSNNTKLYRSCMRHYALKWRLKDGDEAFWLNHAKFYREIAATEAHLNALYDKLIWKPNICQGCGNEIDVHVCHCGELYDFHTLEHQFTPKGCACGYVKFDDLPRSLTMPEYPRDK